MPPFDTDMIQASVVSEINRGDVTLDALVETVERGGVEAQQVLDQHFGGFIGASSAQSDVLGFLVHYQKVTSAIQEKRDQFPGFGEATTGVQYDRKRRGYFRHFEHGSVFWTSEFGAHEVHGAIRDKYASFGWQNSYLGFPNTDELTTHVAGTEVRYSNFDYGTIRWTSHQGASVDLSLSAWVERHQLGAWVHLSGQGFTPGGTVRFAVGGLTNVNGRKSAGVFAIAQPDGTFHDVVWDGRIWNAGGNAEIFAIDEATGGEISRPIPALY